MQTNHDNQAALSQTDREYFRELAADIVAQGNPDGDVFEEMQAAHDRRQSFAREMAQGQTERAKMARRLLAAKIWADIRARDAVDSVFAGFQFARDESFRSDLRAQLLGGYEVAR